MLRLAESSRLSSTHGSLVSRRRPRHAEACGRNFGVRAFAQKTSNNFLEPVEFVSWVALVANVHQLAALECVQRQINLGAAHVPGENHLAISSAPVPSALGRGRCAAAAASSKNSSRPLCGCISCDGSVSGSYGPCSTRPSGSAFAAPSIRKKTSRAALMTGHVSVTRQLCFCCGT